MQAEEHSFYWGQHDRRDTAAAAANPGSSSSSTGPAAAANFFEAAIDRTLVLHINEAETPWDLLEIADLQTSSIKLTHWLELLFRYHWN